MRTKAQVTKAKASKWDRIKLKWVCNKGNNQQNTKVPYENGKKDVSITYVTRDRFPD
jgi:hypothetical protein